MHDDYVLASLGVLYQESILANIQTNGSSEFIDHIGLVYVDVGCVYVFASLGFLCFYVIGMLGLGTYVFFHVYKIQIGVVVDVVMTTPRNLLTFSIFAILLFSFVICFNKIFCTMYLKKYFKFGSILNMVMHIDFLFDMCK